VALATLFFWGYRGFGIQVRGADFPEMAHVLQKGLLFPKLSAVVSFGEAYPFGGHVPSRENQQHLTIDLLDLNRPAIPVVRPAQ
jgi:hypothetical protein